MMLYWSISAHQKALAYEKNTRAFIEQMGVKEQAQFQLKELAESFSLGLYQNEEKEQMEKIRSRQKELKETSVQNAMYAILLGIGILVFSFFVSLRTFSVMGSLVGLVSLWIGLSTPIMMMTIHKEVEYLGDVVLAFESKGVWGSIIKLFESGETVVALTILLFSVLIPGVKTITLLFVSIFMESPFAHEIVRFFKMIGKWSMVDVFVVATFLVYLAGNGGEVSRAEVEVGLYFFLFYVIVSMLVSLSTDKLLHSLKGRAD